MKLPEIRGTIRRRILANYRVDPEAVARVLPAPFEPLVTNGFTIAGICLIRMAELRPRFLPSVIGIGSENAAHRFAVTWERDGVRQEGLYIPRRDTDCRFNVLAGGRLFPGDHHYARFCTSETPDALSVAVKSRDGEMEVEVRGRPVDAFPETSIFPSLAAASEFAEGGSYGWSATRDPERFDTLELRCRKWQASSLEVERIRSSFFDDPERFPPGTVAFDHALLMMNVDHSWHAQDDVRASC